jgi:hypothetical protein
MRPVQAGSVYRGDTVDDQREVSRSHISWDKTSRGVVKMARLNYETRGITTQ